MALKGTLVYNKVNQSNLEQDVALTVYGMDTIAKLNLYMVYEGNDYNRDMDKWRLFDSVYDKNYENLEFNAENVGDEWRRLDISQAGKFTSNLQNKKFGAVVAATVRYVMTHGKNANTSKDVIDGYVIQGKDYNTVSESITYDEEGTEIGRFTKEYGILTKLAIHTPLMSLEMEEDTSTNNINDYLKLDGTKMFAPLKVKDKYGRITSKTPVKTNSYKLVGAFLGFPFKVQAVDDEDSTVVGMYQTMDEVIEAHPDKNFAWIKDRLYRIVSDDDLQEVMQGYYDYDGVIAIDTETTGLNINFKSRTEEADKLVGICLSKKEGTGDFIPLNMKHFPNVCGGDHWFFMEHYMKKFLESHKFVTHNLSFDWKVFYIYGINLNAVFDTMLAYSCTERYKHRNFEVGLKDLTRNIFGRDMIELSDFVYGMDWSKSGVKFWDLSYEQCRQYAPTDADSTLCLYNFVIATKLLERFEAQAIFEIELKYAKVIGYSEFWGYHINVDELPHLVNEVDNSLKHYKQEMLKIAGYAFNPDSPQQLGAVMYDELKMPKLHDARKTDKTTLKELSEINNLPHADFLTLLTEYRKSAGTYKNFIKRKDEFISEDGYIFPHVYSFGTDTGRCSIKEPNYQSYNDIIKKRVTPRRGFKMFDCDFSQIEYRVLCSIAQEENLKKSFSDPDMDYHTYQAARMFDVPYGAVTGAMRKQAKGFNFGLPYGMGDKSLGLRIFGQATKENTAKAAKLRIKYFVGQENIKKWFEVTRDNAIADGYSRTLFGRSRYYFKEIFDEAKIRRQAGNHVIQGTAADIYKMACNRFFDMIVAKGWLDKVLMDAFIHDEILGEVSDEINPFEFVEAWRTAFEVPIEGFCKLYAGFGMGNSWYEAKKQDLTPPFIEEIITSPLRANWNKTSDEFIAWIYEARYDYELRRVIDYFNMPSSQGEIIKPIIEAYMREKLNDCPERHIVNVMGEAEKYKVMKGGKFKEWKLDLQDAISVFCDWMNEYKGPGTLDRSKINILAATDAAVKAPEQQTTFNIENTNMSDMEFNIRMTKERGYHIDMTDCACYLDISLLEQAGKVDEFISKFCIKQELSEGTEETADIAIALPKVVLLDIGADGKCNSYNTAFCIKSSMFMALQPYMYGLMQLTGRVM